MVTRRRGKGTTVKATSAKPAKPATRTKKTKKTEDETKPELPAPPASEPEGASVTGLAAPEENPSKEDFDGAVVTLRIKDCRDCPHLQDYGPIAESNKQRRRYGCLPLVLRRRAGEDVEYPFIEVSSEHVRDDQSWRPHPKCPLGLS